jgi:trk system potassium uptake protein
MARRVGAADGGVRPAWWRRAVVVGGRVATWAVLGPPLAGVRWWGRLRPAQQVVLGFALYAMAGWALLCLPWANRDVGGQPWWSGWLDHGFSAVSAISTTGLTTIAVGERYSFFGQLVLLMLFQVGALGFMTLSSVLVLARGRPLTDARMGVLKAGFSVPHYFVMSNFLVQVVVYTAVCQSIGALILWWRLSVLGAETPVWSAVFHSVSAFATAGFSLYPTSLEAFRGDWVINLTIGVLSYLGAIGFIVVQDLWYSIKLRERMLTFTSKVILWMTAAIFVGGTAVMFLFEPSLRGLPAAERLLASAFQVASASSTAGFNTVPIGALSEPGLVVVLLAMLVGASPSGTGGGIKTTSVSAVLGNLVSVLRGRSVVVWMGHEIPMVRVLYAFATCSLYLLGVCGGVLVLTSTEQKPFLPIVFEVVSALCTVGLSTGITSDLSPWGKAAIMVLMFAGRCGPLTIGLAMLRPEPRAGERSADDLAI